MLSLYDTTMSPGTTVVQLLTGKRPVGANTHTGSRTENHLLHLVEPVDQLAGSYEEEHHSQHDLQAA